MSLRIIEVEQLGRYDVQVGDDKYQTFPGTKLAVYDEPSGLVVAVFGDVSHPDTLRDLEAALPALNQVYGYA